MEFSHLSKIKPLALVALLACLGSCAKKQIDSRGQPSPKASAELTSEAEKQPSRDLASPKPCAAARVQAPIEALEEPAPTASVQPTAPRIGRSQPRPASSEKTKPAALPTDYEFHREPASLKEPLAASGLFRDFWIWLGMGAHYTSSSQSVPGFSDVEYGKIKALTKAIRAGFFLNDNFGLDLGYNDIPGEVSRSSTISVSNGSYNWRTLNIEALYRREEASPWVARLGVQMHQQPFLVPLSANSITVAENNITMVVVGLEYRHMRKKVRLEYALKYLHPISSSSDLTSDFEMKPRFSAAGSVGASYEIKESVFLGAVLGVAYQANSFSYKNRSGSSFAGKQTVLSTSAEIRLGVEF